MQIKTEIKQVMRKGSWLYKGRNLLPTPIFEGFEHKTGVFPDPSRFFFHQRGHGCAQIPIKLQEEQAGFWQLLSLPIPCPLWVHFSEKMDNFRAVPKSSSSLGKEIEAESWFLQAKSDKGREIFQQG